MTTSGTTAFNMEFTELAEEAWERAGREMRSGYDLRTARGISLAISLLYKLGIIFSQSLQLEQKRQQ